MPVERKVTVTRTTRTTIDLNGEDIEAILRAHFYIPSYANADVHCHYGEISITFMWLQTEEEELDD